MPVTRKQSATSAKSANTVTLSGGRKPGVKVGVSFSRKAKLFKPGGYLAWYSSTDHMGLVNAVRRGIPASSLVELTAALDVTRTFFVESLRLGRSTIEDRIKNNSTLNHTESEAVLRATKVLVQAIEVFEDEASAQTWMKREIRSLGGVPPLSLLDTYSGYEIIMDTLGRIEQGIAA